MGARARRLAVAISTSLLITLSACSSDAAPDDLRPDTPKPDTAATSRAPGAATTSSYVALGDSFTAGPGIDPQRPDAGLCQRSDQNWPSLLAATAQLDLTDVSCSGATTADLAATVAAGAVPADTGLVTVSAGGNDGGLFLSLIRACTTGAEACRTLVDQETPAILERTTTDLVSLLQTIVSDAPGATVALVGYPRIMPATGTCEAVGIAAADAASVASAEAELDTALATAADRAGVAYVSLLEPSAGHDACAGDEAWTNGRSPTPGDGIFFHPNRRGMAAVAALVATAVAG